MFEIKVLLAAVYGNYETMLVEEAVEKLDRSASGEGSQHLALRFSRVHSLYSSYKRYIVT